MREQCNTAMPGRLPCTRALQAPRSPHQQSTSWRDLSWPWEQFSCVPLFYLPSSLSLTRETLGVPPSVGTAQSLACSRLKSFNCPAGPQQHLGQALPWQRWKG